MIPLSGDIPDSKGAICGKIDSNSIVRGTSTLKRGFAHMLKNGVFFAPSAYEAGFMSESHTERNLKKIYKLFEKFILNSTL